MKLITALIVSIHSPTIYGSRLFRRMNTAPVVDLSYGSFQGNTTGNVTSFLGIPYAQAPVGQLRFAPPQAPNKTSGVQQATSYGAGCPQQPVPLPNITGLVVLPATPVPNQSEDCLFINVVKPTTIESGQKLPVLFWIYGGSFATGDTSQYPAQPLVERSIALDQPVIYVSINYRLNIFGFLEGQEVLDAGITNLGLRDQRFALEWVHNNIEQFGGDPSRVILWGESAGGLSVGLQMLMNDGNNEGLFHGAFIESGSPQANRNESIGQSTLDTLVEEANCTSSSNALDCLRAAPTNFLVNFAKNVAKWGPSVDGSIVARNPQDSVAAGLYSRIPVVAGDCDDEGTLFELTDLNITTDQGFLEYVAENYAIGATTNDLAEIAVVYPSNVSLGSPFGTGDANAITPQFKRLSAFQGDWTNQAPRRLFLSTISKTQNTWSFLYKRNKFLEIVGSAHTTDIPEFYGLVSTPDYIGTDALVSFAYTLNPGNMTNPKSLLSTIEWPMWASNLTAPPLLTFLDPAPNVSFTPDTYRAYPMDLLNYLSRTLF